MFRRAFDLRSAIFAWWSRPLAAETATPISPAISFIEWPCSACSSTGRSNAQTEVCDCFTDQYPSLFLYVLLLRIWGGVRDFPERVVFIAVLRRNFTGIALLPKDH